jgi:hypothetical protein
LMVLELIAGRMDKIFMKEISKMEWGTGKENGLLDRQNILEITQKV